MTIQANSIYQGIIQEPEASSMINIAAYSQPACAAIQIALISLLREWGIKPQCVVGHSSGKSDLKHQVL